MEATDDLTSYRLRKRIHELEAENARYYKNQNLARKWEFRITGVVLLAIGAGIPLVAYPSYNLSPIANVLLMVGISALSSAPSRCFSTRSVSSARRSQKTST